LVVVGLLSLVFALASAGYLERSVQFLTPELPYCFTTKYAVVMIVRRLPRAAASSRA